MMGRNELILASLIGLMLMVWWHRQPAVAQLDTSALLTSPPIGLSAQQSQPEELEPGLALDRCQKRSRCAVVYLAPWCPACHQFAGRHHEIQAHLAGHDVGLLMVVGGDQDRQKEIEFRRQLGMQALLDSPDGHFMKTHKVDRFPSFFVSDRNGRIEASGSRARSIINDLLSQQH